MSGSRSNQTGERSAVAAGFIYFAGVMMLMAGIFQLITGFVALFENEFYLKTPKYLLQFDVTTWGWIHVLLGVLLAVAGFGLIVGKTWARVIAIIVASLSALANFAFIPYYPLWSIIIIVLDIFVIWAVAVHGRELS